MRARRTASIGTLATLVIVAMFVGLGEATATPLLPPGHRHHHLHLKPRLRCGLPLRHRAARRSGSRFSPDGHRVVLASQGDGTVRTVGFDPETGALGGANVVATLPGAAGLALAPA